MDYTQHIHLPQFAASDRIHHDDFNAAFAAIDAAAAANADAIPRIVFGSYAGDGAFERTISLDFTPKLVYLCIECGMTYYSNNDFFGGLALTGHPVVRSGKTIVEIVENGFCVGSDGIKKSNYGGNTFFYFAIG